MSQVEIQSSYVVSTVCAAIVKYGQQMSPWRYSSLFFDSENLFRAKRECDYGLIDLVRRVQRHYSPQSKALSRILSQTCFAYMIEVISVCYKTTPPINKHLEGSLHPVIFDQVLDFDRN